MKHPRPPVPMPRAAQRPGRAPLRAFAVALVTPVVAILAALAWHDGWRAGVWPGGPDLIGAALACDCARLQGSATLIEMTAITLVAAYALAFAILRFASPARS